MTQELIDYVRERRPLQAKVIGEERLAEIVESIVQEWPADGLASCGRDSQEEQGLLAGVKERVMREGRHGFLWTIVLTVFLSVVIRMVLEWWLSRLANRATMRSWQERIRSQS